MKIQRWASVISLFFMFNIVLIAGCNQATTQTTSIPVTTISRPDASNLIQKNIGNPNFVILDVRTADEFKYRHIAGAIDMDYESVNFKENIRKLDKNKQYLVYCSTGVLGEAATQTMVGLGFKEVQNIAGGFTAWVQDGYITCGCPGKIVN